MMTSYETLSLMIASCTFLLALLTFVAVMIKLHEHNRDTDKK